MNLMDLFIKIGVDDQASSKVGSISNKLGNGLKTAARVGTAALAKTGAALVKLAKDSISAYAEYEQLEGGIEKLFGQESMKKVLANADMAYKTAGMSANKYLETTTSFAASLIAGLDGDTAKAAEYADMAIRDMSDNANTFGTDISMIQNAYQGFAKQNYTMLDNLKLGYGGTASEMARLINDSGVLGDTVTVTADNINSVSFDKIIEAINVTQERMGIMGTTMTEAEGTIKGSVEAVKASWENLMIAMINDLDSVGEKFDILADNIGTAWGNIKPSLSALSSSIGNLVDEKFPSLATAIDVLIPLVTGLFAGFASYQVVTKTASAFAMLKTVLSGGASLASGGVIGLALAAITTYATTMFMALKSKDARDAIAGFTQKLVTTNSEIQKFNKLYSDALNMRVEKPIVTEEQAAIFDEGFKQVLEAYGFEFESSTVSQIDIIKALYEKMGWEFPSSPGENVLFDSSIPTLSDGINHFYETWGNVDLRNPNFGMDDSAILPRTITPDNDNKTLIDKLNNAGKNTTNINITINGAKYKDEDELADDVMNRLMQHIDGRGAAND